MPTTFRAGQRLTADALQRTIPDRVTQNSDQVVNNSETLVDSDMEVTVDGLLRIDFDLRVQTANAASGFKWKWNETGSAESVSYAVGSPGSASAGGSADNDTMRWQMLDGFSTTNFVMGAATGVGRVNGVLIVDGSGTVTLQFAQQVATAADTTLHSDSFATVTRLGS